MPVDARRVKEMFGAALDIPEADARDAYLDRECEDDGELRQRLDALLKAHEAPASALKQPLAGEGTVAYVASEKPGTIVAGRYKLLESIGEGGMGTVWVAEQTEPVRRKVAIKLIKAGMDSRSVLARFEAERQALAMMDHPNIAKVLDGGLTEQGRPYFVMEYVKGVPITEYCDATKLSIHDRLQLFIQVCQAVQHAHQKGIIHRDLKPSNILVAPYDDKPVPKIIDFGLAKAMHQSLTERTLHTAHESVLGTPLYMSPEQAQLNNLDVDTRSDIYSLGVLLYEMLTGTTPLEKQRFRQAAWDEVRRIIREEDPPRPSTRLSSIDTLPSLAAGRHTDPLKLTRLVKGELDWIVMKALEKDRTRRYETANGFAADVMRYLSGEAVTAVPPSAGYRLKKFVRRNRPQVIAASLVLLALVAGVAGTTVGLFQANAEAAKARAAEAETAAQLTKTRAAEAAASAEAANARKAEATAVSREKQEMRARETAEAVATFMQEVFAQGSAEGQASPTREVNRDLTVKAAMDHAAKAIAGRFPDRPDIEAAVRNTIGETYLDLAAYPEAEREYTKALALTEKFFGQDHLETLTSVNALAGLFLAKADYAAAEALYKRALAGFETVLGPENPKTLNGINNLAELYRRRGNYAAAEPLFKRALAGWEKDQGPDHPNTLSSVNNLAILYLEMTDYAAAEPLFIRALAGTEKAHGPDHPDTLRSVRNLAMLYHKRADYAAAEPLYKRALAGTEKVLGPDHPGTLINVGDLAVLYGDRADYAAAEPLSKRALAGFEKAHGPEHPDTLKSVNNLAAMYYFMRRLGEAIPLQEEAHRRQRKVLGEDHPDTLTASANLGVSYLDAGRPAEAVPLLERAYAARGRNPDLSKYTPKLHDAYVRAGRKADALRLAGEYLADARKTAPPGSPQLGTLLTFAGRMNLAHDPVVAEQLLRESLAIRENLAPTAWTTANSKSILGVALLGQRKYADAEPLLLAGYAGLAANAASIPAAGKYNLPDALDRLIQLYTETNKPDEVKKWQAEKAKMAQRKVTKD